MFLQDESESAVKMAEEDLVDTSQDFYEYIHYFGHLTCRISLQKELRPMKIWRSKADPSPHRIGGSSRTLQICTRGQGQIYRQEDFICS